MTALQVSIAFVLSVVCMLGSDIAPEAATHVTVATLEDALDSNRIEDNTLAVAVEWARVRDSATVGRAKRRAEFFLGYVKGRIGVSAPDWWQNMLRAGAAPQLARNSFDSQQCVQLWKGKELNWQFSGFDDVTSNLDAMKLRKGTTELVLMKSDVIDTTRGSTEWSYRQDGAIAGMMADGACVIACRCPASSMVGGPSEVICVDAKSGKPIWRQSLDDGLQARTSYSGGWHGSFTDIRISDEVVVVWIGHDVSVCCHVFDKKSGRRIMSFASASVERARLPTQ